jgi:hypothetical protein
MGSIFDKAEKTPQKRADELTEVEKKFKERKNHEKKIFSDITDSEYWFCVCFQNREQKEEFLKKIGWWKIGDKYLDGMAAARASGITLGNEPKRYKLRVVKKWGKLCKK